ncbi:MAG: dihydrofolate reductase family protein [Mucilaginibacter sp.]
MRKLKLVMQMTIDGFVAGPNGENDWVFLPGKQDPAALQSTIDLAASCDTILGGRKLIQGGFAGYWEDVFNNQPDNIWHPFAKLMVEHRKIIFSRTGAEIEGSNMKVETRDLATVVNELKQQSGKDIIVYGGVEFASSLVELGLVDEYYFVVNPVAIGSGLSIFKERKVMTLKSSVAYTHGKVMNKYVPVQPGA